MDFMELAAARYSVRKFDDRPIEPEKLEKILRAGLLAPTAKNQQPQKVFVVRSKEALEKLGACTQCVYGANTVLLICNDVRESWKRPFDGKDSGDVDTSIVLTHMMLEAWELGVGSVWVMFFDADKLRKAFELPEHLIPVSLMPIGYAAPDASPSPRHAESKPLSELVSYL
jgi:nitroreductase